MSAPKVFYVHSGTGSVHLAQAYPHESIAWCGVGLRFRHIQREGELAEVTCKTCLRRLALGHPLARGARA